MWFYSVFLPSHMLTLFHLLFKTKDTFTCFEIFVKSQAYSITGF